MLCGLMHIGSYPNCPPLEPVQEGATSQNVQIGMHCVCTMRKCVSFTQYIHLQHSEHFNSVSLALQSFAV